MSTLGCWTWPITKGAVISAAIVVRRSFRASIAKIYHDVMSSYFRYHSLEELREDARKRGLRIPLEPDRAKVQEILARPALVGPMRVGNRLTIHPMEGCDGDRNGSP